MDDAPKRKGDGVTFIHSSLDDAGLSAAEFRVFCHVARRAGDVGKCFAAIESIAKVCRLSLNTTRKALKVLTSHKFIRQERRDGRTTAYQTAPISDWHPYQTTAPLPNESRATKAAQDTPTKRGGDTPTKMLPLSVSPEVTPPKAIPTTRPIASNLGTLKPIPEGRRTVELVARCRKIFGEAEMQRCHKQWYDLAKTDPNKLESVLNETASAQTEGRIKTTAARFAQDYLGRLN